jgi:hypothetical protein
MPIWGRGSASCQTVSDHRCGVDDAVEILGGDGTGFDRGFPQRQVFGDRGVGDLRRVVITDQR